MSSAWQGQKGAQDEGPGGRKGPKGDPGLTADHQLCRSRKGEWPGLALQQCQGKACLLRLENPEGSGYGAYPESTPDGKLPWVCSENKLPLWSGGGGASLPSGPSRADFLSSLREESSGPVSVAPTSDPRSLVPLLLPGFLNVIVGPCRTAWLRWMQGTRSLTCVHVSQLCAPTAL